MHLCVLLLTSQRGDLAACVLTISSEALSALIPASVRGLADGASGSSCVHTFASSICRGAWRWLALVTVLVLSSLWQQWHDQIAAGLHVDLFHVGWLLCQRQSRRDRCCTGVWSLRHEIMHRLQDIWYGTGACCLAASLCAPGPRHSKR
jgi:hypothetical protein